MRSVTASPGVTCDPCPDCGARMVLRDSRFGLFWGCSRWPACNGKHGAHPDGRPLGKPATLAVRQARMAAHAAFDPIWLGGAMRRPEAYRWLTRAMGRQRQVHIGELGLEECALVVRLCELRMREALRRAGGAA